MSESIKLLKARIADLEGQVALMLTQSRDSYSKGYHAGLRCHGKTLEWYFHERERLKRLARQV